MSTSLGRISRGIVPEKHAQDSVSISSTVDLDNDDPRDDKRRTLVVWNVAMSVFHMILFCVTLLFGDVNLRGQVYKTTLNVTLQ